LKEGVENTPSFFGDDMIILCIICIFAAIGSIAYAIYTYQHCAKINEVNIRENEKLELEHS
jgi:hypothetical protein